MLERSEKSSLLNPEESSERKQQEQSQLQQRQRRHDISPFAQMDRLFDEVFKRPFFSLWSHRMGGEEMEEQLFVPVDIFEDGESVVVKAELPGIPKEAVNVQLTPDTITITGEKKSEHRVEEKGFSRLESSYGSFSRTCQLPAECYSDKARAVFKDGVLEVRIPKSQEVKQRSRKLTIE